MFIYQYNINKIVKYKGKKSSQLLFVFLQDSSPILKGSCRNTAGSL